MKQQFESPEERQLRQRQATMRRIRVLAVITVLVIGARFIVKDPPPPPKADISKQTLRYRPGLLETIPASTLKKMDPALLARLQKADQEARMAKLKELPAGVVPGQYVPAEIPVDNKAMEEEYKQLEYVYAKRREAKLKEQEMVLAHDLTKNTLVQFRSGGFMKVEKTNPGVRHLQIQVDRTLLATVPHNMVLNVSGDAVNWKQPVPRGFVQLKPANGITITVSKETSKRITTKKSLYDET